MQTKKTANTKDKLHPRNKHRERYDFTLLIKCLPELEKFVKVNEYHDQTIDFFDPEAVKVLNRALLKQYYDIVYWDIPMQYLCPPIPGRADYIHYIADLLAGDNSQQKASGKQMRCLDIGVGANCIYPIIGCKEYGWSFVGSDVDPVAIASAKKIVEANPILKNTVELRLQPNPAHVLMGIIKKGEHFDAVLCNPPFHRSQQEAQEAAVRKLSNLKGRKISRAILNFGGHRNELWCEGGEVGFVRRMIRDSRELATSCTWFTTLLSKSEHLEKVHEELEKAGVIEVKSISMGQGNKISRIVAWTFMEKGKRNS